MRTFFIVLLLALTFVPDDVDAWFFRRVRLSRIWRTTLKKTGVCNVACRWPSSTACKYCLGRKRGMNVEQDLAEPSEDAMIFHDLDDNHDGVIEVSEIAKFSGLKMSNPILRKTFKQADRNRDGLLDIGEFRHFNFKNHKQFMKAFADDEEDADDA